MIITNTYENIKSPHYEVSQIRACKDYRCTWATDAITYTTAIRNIQNPDLYTNVLDMYILLFETINFHSEKLKIFITKLRFIMVCFVEGREFWGVV